MIDVGGFGTTITIVALKSYPIGFIITEFADDIDPVVAEEVETTGYEMLYDGTLFQFDKAAPIKITIAVIAGSTDDINLKILLQARKNNAGSIISQFGDVTSAVINYPDGGKIILSNGTITSGPLADSIQNSGRKKGNAYTFVFGSFAGAQSVEQAISSIASAFT